MLLNMNEDLKQRRPEYVEKTWLGCFPYMTMLTQIKSVKETVDALCRDRLAYPLYSLDALPPDFYLFASI